MARLSIIVAAARNGVIGRDNALPWHLPEDLCYFKRVTMGKPVVMGRKTYESIGRPLPGRRNIVISRNPVFAAPGVEVVASLTAAVALLSSVLAEEDEVMVIGGAQIYAEALPLVDRLYLTRVEAEVAGDTCLPSLDWECWHVVSQKTYNACKHNPYDYSFIVYERIKSD
ncbi:MAG: dihydrofolate reductase [Parahaliea sp.]